MKAMRLLWTCLPVALIITYSAAQAQSQPALVELPFSMVEGYGPFTANHVPPSWQDSTINNPGAKTFHPISGIPLNWQRVKWGYVTIDKYQHAYQNAHTGIYPQSFYEQLQTSWRWKPDPKTLSAKPLRCVVYLATGYDQNGKRWVLVDTDNDYDLADEQVLEPLPRFHQDPTAANTCQVHYERYRQGQVDKTTTSMAVWLAEDGIQVSFPSYALASFKTARQTHAIAVVSAWFIDPTFQPSTIVNLTDSAAIKPIQAIYQSSRKIIPKLMSKPGEYLTIDEDTYQYVGIDLDRKLIRLKKMASQDSLYSTQKGYKAPLFTGLEFSTGKAVSLQAYRGKYVFIDFWGTWCGPCLAELKYLKTAYDRTNRDAIEFIGIVSNDTPERLRTFLAKESLPWPQLLSDQQNKLTELYQVERYPTTILLDPEGKVLFTGLTGSNVLDILGRLNTLK